MPVISGKDKDKNKILVDEDASISDAISEAFDNVEISTIGKLCLDARVSKSLTQEQASALLKVRVKIIKDFENGDQIDLPGLAYKIGFVRSYARLLGLDGDVLVSEFKESIEVNDFKEEYKFLSPEINNNKMLPLGAVLSFLIALAVYSGWYYTDRNNKVSVVSNDIIDTEPKKIAGISEINEIDNNNYVIIEDNLTSNNSSSFETKNSPSQTIDPTFQENINITENAQNTFSNEKNLELKNEIIRGNSNTIDTKNMESTTNEMSAEANERDPSTEMVLKATGNSWVEIEDIDGNILMTRLMRPGETYVVPKINGLTFNTGNAGALSLSQGEVVVPTLGAIGEIITARPLNIKAFQKQY